MEVIKAHAGGGLAPALDALQVGDGNLTATPSGTGTAEVGQGVRLFYGLGAIAFGINHAALGSLVMMFFNQVVGLPARWVGTAIALALVFDGIFDPLLGQWSDHVNSRWGRRHPFMYASAIPIAAAFYFLWNPPLGLSEHQMFYYL
ncbi:MAG TPA: MFS transporter, partial [Candidatus Binataceae bacterium]|nr:MFS transporter [Candidatus Binataceae bacterium]